MFAFAFYDAYEDRLVLARDRMGIKPLYYCKRAGELYWASEIKALAKQLRIAPDPFRTLLAVNNNAERSVEYTLFKSVFSVKPGSYVQVQNGSDIESRQYYDLLDDFDQAYYNALDRTPRSQIAEMFGEHFNSSVRQMLISDAPMGSFVSGGIDSSLISAMAVNEDANLKLFTANVLGKYSEFSDVKTLSKHIGTPILDYKFEPEMMLRDWVEATYHYDSPIVVHVNAIPLANVARLARDSGVKAVLTGEGADELFLGYPTLLTNRYKSLASFPVNAIKSLYRFSPKLHNYLFPELSSSPLSFINKLSHGFENERLEEEALSTFSSLSPKNQTEQLMTVKMIRDGLVALLHRNDRMGMMSSIEARFPFLDESLVKFAINLPSKFKIGRSKRFHNCKHPFLIDKWVVREHAQKWLPPEIVHKKKNGFPMFGHKFLKLKPEFFKGGWLADALGLGDRSIDDLVAKQDPYFMAKLGSVELFGRIYAEGADHEKLKDHVNSFAKVIVDHSVGQKLVALCGAMNLTHFVYG
jgi:asparagine synthase (glutamine-hydrolysing)